MLKLLYSTWRHVHEVVDCTFGNDDRNIHLGLAANGVNPFKLQRCNWSKWPVMLLNYNKKKISSC